MIVSKILFVSCCSQPDLKTVIVFLTTRVKQPNLYHHKNLTRCISYICATVKIHPNLEANKATIMRYWINTSYGLNPDMKIHSEIMMSMGKGYMQSNSIKNNLNT